MKSEREIPRSTSKSAGENASMPTNANPTMNTWALLKPLKREEAIYQIIPYHLDLEHSIYIGLAPLIP